MKPALLVIDVQKEFYKINPAAAQSLTDAVEYINAAIEIFREKELPVICIQHMNEADKLVPGEEGFDLPEGLAVLPSDLHIHKTYGNSFNKTGLANALHAQEIDTLIVTGFCAEYCVLATVQGARDLDFTPIILRGSLASDNQEHIRFVEEICDLITYRALTIMLG